MKQFLVFPTLRMINGFVNHNFISVQQSSLDLSVSNSVSFIEMQFDFKPTNVACESPTDVVALLRNNIKLAIL
jgi:hypothetical protein